MKRLLPYLLVGVFAFVALVSLYFAYQANMKTKTIAPQYKKVSAVIGTEIPVSVKTDGVSLYFEHNGERLSLTNRITDLMVGTDYTFTFTNDSGMKQGVFIPALRESIVTDATQTVSISIKFTNPGIYYFMGNIYQTGWDGLKSGFEVGMDTIVTQPPTQSTPTVTPTATVTPTPTEPPGTTFSCANVTEIPQAECEALVALYNSTNGPGWTNKTGWLQTNTPCSWRGIHCNPATLRHVVDIEISGNNLRGNIPSNIGYLASLQYLILDDNQLSGNIPTSIGNLTNLLILRVYNNRLSGNIPISIGNLTNLQYLYLNYNQLSGVIPSSLSGLIHIFGLNTKFEDNTLTGVESQTVCPWLAEHTSDDWWQYQGGNISSDPCVNGPTNTPTTTPTPTPTGPPNTTFSCANVTEIPQAECEALVALYNSTNGPGWTTNVGWLQSSSPCNWFGVDCQNNQPNTHVSAVIVNSNNLRGELPLNIGNLTQLVNLNLTTNQISGTIPESVWGLYRLTDLHLDGNQFTGTIPVSIGNLSLLQSLGLSVNRLSGTIPASIGVLTRLLVLDLRFNQLIGPIPESIGNLNLLRSFLIQHNQLTGTIPASFANLTAINGNGVFLDNNSLTGVENQSVCPWLSAHSLSNWWQLQSPPISSDPCAGGSDVIKEAQPVAARTSRVALPKTMPLPSSNILERITLFFQQLLQNVFGKK